MPGRPDYPALPQTVMPEFVRIANSWEAAILGKIRHNEWGL
jgi:hypothetical protein